MYIEVGGSGIMLIQFNFKNHKSFYDKSYIDMIATMEKRHLENTIDVNGIKLLPFLTIYGANASGKSTVIDAFYFMARAVVRTFDSNVNEQFLVAPFIFGEGTKNEPSEFEIFINIGDYEYRYGFIATRDSIKEEWFYKKLFKKDSRVKEQMIFERENNNICFSNHFSSCQQYASLINEKSLLLSFLGRKEIGEFGSIYNWFSNIIYINDFTNNNMGLAGSIKLLHQDRLLYNKFINILSEIDPCLKDLDIIEREDENQIIKYDVYGKHLSVDNDDKYYSLPLDGESAGTKKIIRTLPLIIKSLMDGSLLFVDELDTQLHPLLFKKIVSLYTDSDINVNNAQLVFTSHNTYILNSNDVRRDQVMFVSKNIDGKSKLYSLAEFKKLRCDADYEKKYFSGSFGSIPFLDI